MKKPFLCRIGLHKWVELGWTSLVLAVVLFECARCRHREERSSLGIFYSDCPPEGWPEIKT